MTRYRPSSFWRVYRPSRCRGPQTRKGGTKPIYPAM